MKQIQKVEYVFELNDMFIFTQDVGGYHKGDYLIISEIDGRCLYYTTADTFDDSSCRATSGALWLSELLNVGYVSYEGTLVKQ